MKKANMFSTNILPFSPASSPAFSPAMALFSLALISFAMLSPLSSAQNAQTENAQNIYLHDFLEMQLNITGGFKLMAEKDNAVLKKVSAELSLIPQQSFRQKLLRQEKIGQNIPSGISFEWEDQTLGTKNFAYSAIVKTNNNRLKVQKKTPFPVNSDFLESEKLEFEKYLLPSEKIDSDHPAIIAKAAELSEGKDDLFKVLFELASWVEEYVAYDLNSITASATQKASWVLEHKQGVCDEMTALFIAMARSLGIPARFVKGISYTTSDLFDSNWQPHGWAEVFFPDVGWVSFDIAFGEFGYIDVTHIKLKDGIDPSEPDSIYKWIADGVKLEPQPLQWKISLLERGKVIPEEIALEQKILAREVAFGSYNLITGIATNTAPYYVATTLYLNLPKELKVSGRNKKNILLSPHETREIYWAIKVADYLEDHYVYRFPSVLRSEKNTTMEDSFIAQADGNTYSKEEIEQLISGENKKYSQKIILSCEYPSEINLNEEAAAACTLYNKGNVNLMNIAFCFDKNCESTDLLINQKKNKLISLPTDKIGWNKALVGAGNSDFEKITSLEYLVYDPPSLQMAANTPEIISGDETVPLTVKVRKKSFSAPNKVMIKLQGPGFAHKWEAEKLENEEIVIFNIDPSRFGARNSLEITASWEDWHGKKFSEAKKIIVKKEAASFAERIKISFFDVINKIY